MNDSNLQRITVSDEALIKRSCKYLICDTALATTSALGLMVTASCCVCRSAALGVEA